MQSLHQQQHSISVCSYCDCSDMSQQHTAAGQRRLSTASNDSTSNSNSIVAGTTTVHTQQWQHKSQKPTTALEQQCQQRQCAVTSSVAVPRLSPKDAAANENSLKAGSTWCEISVNAFTYTAPPSKPAQHMPEISNCQPQQPPSINFPGLNQARLSLCKCAEACHIGN